MNKSLTRYIFIGVVIFISISLIYTNIVGKKQDNEYYQDYQQYQEAVKLYESNQLDKSERLLDSLIEKYPEQQTFYYTLGLVNSGQSDFKQAAIFYQKAINLRPALLQDQTFTFKIGESLYHINELEMAKSYLSLPVPEQFQGKKDELLKSIDQQL